VASLASLMRQKLEQKKQSGVEKIFGGDLFESVHALGEHEKAEDEGR
jgi:hypothetical protein